MDPIYPPTRAIRGALSARMKTTIAFLLALSSWHFFRSMFLYDSIWFAIPGALLTMLALRFIHRAMRYHSGQTTLVDWSETSLRIVEFPGIWHISTISGIRRFDRNRSGYTVSLECGSTFHLHHGDVCPMLAAMLDAQLGCPRE